MGTHRAGLTRPPARAATPELRAWLAEATRLSADEAIGAVVAAAGRELLARLGVEAPTGVLEALAPHAPRPRLAEWAHRAPPASVVAPTALVGHLHEAVLGTDERRARGVHYTDPALAARLVRWAVTGWVAWPPTTPLRVLDPAVGAGALLVAAGQAQVEAGLPVDTVLARLEGVDVDPVAVATARVALVLWAASAGPVGRAAPASRPALSVGSGLDAAAGGGAWDLVVGNPPFASPLRQGAAARPADAERALRRHGLGAEGYLDAAAVFLLAAVSAVRPGGRVLLIVPDSLLGARDARRVRERVTELADLVGLWVTDEPAFAASVDVAALVLERRGTGVSEAGESGGLSVATGVAVRAGATQPRPTGAGWTEALARARCVPIVDPPAGAVPLGEVAEVRAGFRQHFYAMAPHLAEASDTGGAGAWAAVLTAASVDPLVSLWGRRPVRIAGRRWVAPMVDVDAVEADDGRVGAWVRARLVPKVVLAPQTRVIEVVVDPDGALVPGVPLVSIEPRPDAALDPDPTLALWMLAAALSGPAATAWALARAAGTARHRDAVKLAAPLVREMPLPIDRGAWREVAQDLRAGAPLADRGAALSVAWGLDPAHPVVGWWRARLLRG